MRLLRLDEVEAGPHDRVFRHARLRAVIVWLAGFAAATASIVYAYARKWPPGYVIGSLLLLFVLLTFRMVAARFHRSNWLVRMNDAGLYVQYRSYLNFQLPADDRTVLFLPFGQIASARLVKERVDTPDAAKPGAAQTRYVRYVEFEVSDDSRPLAEALHAERSERAAPTKGWFGSTSTLYRDYPVELTTPTSLRIHWDVVPAARTFLDVLRPYTAISDPVYLSEDFTHLISLSREDQQQRLRELAARGQTITAVYAARRLYGCSLRDAKEMVDSLDAQPPDRRRS